MSLVAVACAKPKVPAAIPPQPPTELTEPTPSDDEEDEGDDEGDDEDEDGASKPAAKPPAGATTRRGDLPTWSREASDKLTKHAKGNRRGWDRLAQMVDRFGPRPAGSKALEGAIDWSIETMQADGLAQARREKVMVPNWQRGKEALRVVSPSTRELEVLGLGGTVATKGILRAPVVVVSSLEDLEKRGADVKGKIVLVNLPMPQYDHDKDESGYGSAVRPRSDGASLAAKHGAKALLIRSVTATSLDTPHTGAMRYADNVPKIPAAAVTIEGAEYLARLAGRGNVEVSLQLGGKLLGDVPSGNAIAELTGRELPDEIVLIGGHIDSWDVGDGASDDGAGCVMAMEAAAMLKELGLVPRRTIRVVLFTNEEFGLNGAKAYFAAHGKEKHVAAIESDSGAGAPRGFGVASDKPEVIAGLQRFSSLFEGLGASDIAKGWGGADISSLMEIGVLGMSLRPEGSRYFDLHHSPADTVDKIDPDHLQRNAAAFALMAYILAERE